MKKHLVLGLCMALLTGQADAQSESRATGCSRPGKPPLYELNEFGDLGWFPDDCDIARLEQNTPTTDVEDNLVTGTRICRWRNADGLCYEFSHDNTGADSPILLRRRLEFDSSIGMVNRTPEFDVCLVNWQWVEPTDPNYIPETQRPTACGVHTFTEGDVCQEIVSTPAPAGWSYCTSRCLAAARGPDQEMEIDNGACVIYVPPDFSFLDNPCWPLGCDDDEDTPPINPQPPIQQNPVNPPPQQDDELCPPGTTDPICLAYQEVFDEGSPDQEGYDFWDGYLDENPPQDPDDLTQDPDFLLHFQNGCGVNHCATLCSDPANAHLEKCQEIMAG
ncbi:MAG: hypothetical protein OXC05_02430 [Halieaceae bacterium]|nr:hypothetical protein [Halieaceae bacterium]